MEAIWATTPPIQRSDLSSVRVVVSTDLDISRCRCLEPTEAIGWSTTPRPLRVMAGVIARSLLNRKPGAVTGRRILVADPEAIPRSMSLAIRLASRRPEDSREKFHLPGYPAEFHLRAMKE